LAAAIAQNEASAHGHGAARLSDVVVLTSAPAQRGSSRIIDEVKRGVDRRLGKVAPGIDCPDRRDAILHAVR
jgi:hypothetical protein